MKSKNRRDVPNAASALVALLFGILLPQATRAQLFAITDSDEVAERLRFGPGVLTPASGAFLSTDLKDELHDGWTQQVALDGINVDFTVRWRFSSTKTLAQRIADAVSVGEPVTWTIVDGATTQVISGSWRFSNTAGITVARFNSSGTNFSNDDGIWGAGTLVDGNHPDGDRFCSAVAWGVGNCDSNDSSQSLWRNGIRSSAPATIRNFMSFEECLVIDAIDDQFTVINDGTVTDLPVLANDECTADEPISVVVRPGDLTPDRGGLATTDGTVVSYAPASGFAGFEEFSYTAQDAGLEGGENPPGVDQDTARILVDVLEDIAPDAVDDEATTLQGQPIKIDVLGNDSLGNEPSEIAVQTTPAHGTATRQLDDTIRYFPSSGFLGEDRFEYRLTDANGDSDVATVRVGVSFLQGSVPIDIVPNDPGNNINLRAGRGSGFDVAILSAGEFFDAPALIDPSSLKLGPSQASIWGAPRLQDVDNDGDDDLVVKFLTQETGIPCGASQANLTGRTFEGRSISGSDVVNTFNCQRIRRRR